MGAEDLDAALVAAIDAGRDVIVPDRHRAAALRLAWARRQLKQGRQVWSTPAIHTWDAWLALRWREAVLRGEVAPLQLLSPGQERALWEAVLARMASPGEDEATLTLHAGALMQSAARAVQSRIAPERTAHSREESLLAAALVEVRRECAARGFLTLRLASADTLQFLRNVPAPLIAGEPALTAMQSALASEYWPGATLLAPQPEVTSGVHTRLLRAADLEQEIAACARWCRAHIDRNPGARLLVISACIEPSLAIQSELLWRSLAAGTGADDVARARWLAVEGGEPLLHQALVAGALEALDLIASDEEIPTGSLLNLLRSPYFTWGTAAETASLGQWFGELGLGRWQVTALREGLREAGLREPAAVRLEQWMAQSAAQLPPREMLGATVWAERFAAVLQGAPFAPAASLDSRDAQRLARWHELLDEFAGLDAVVPPMSRRAALSRLRRLAAQARHQPASGDAAVTLTDALGDPVAGYDAIWVLGLTENRWPAPPRPDSWIALTEQWRAGWPEAGVPQRRAQAQWALACWKARAGELMLSYPEREGDVLHRPARVAEPGVEWFPVTPEPAAEVTGQAAPAQDAQLGPILPAERQTPLRGGAGRLATQQACAFRAQAQCRLGAEPPAQAWAGVPPATRGRMLHLVLQHFWTEVKDQPGLIALTPAAEVALLQRSWQEAVRATPVARWLAPQVLERERQRTLALLANVLQLERERPPFTVEACELPVTWSGDGAHLKLRIDRIDRVGGTAVLLDYKSGAPARIALHEGELQPLQLALYAAALAQQGRTVGAAALLNLKPHEPDIAGVSQDAGLLPAGTRQIEAWSQASQQWEQQLLELMRAHLSGDAALTRDPAVCARCHLPALCRRAGAEVALEEGADESATGQSP